MSDHDSRVDYPDISTYKTRVSRRNAIIIGGTALVVGVGAIGGYYLTLPSGEQRVESTPPTTTPVTEPTQPRILTIAVEPGFPSLSPLTLIRGGAYSTMALNSYEPLVRFGPLIGSIRAEHPMLAQSMEPVGSFRTIRIKLRDGVRFHNGEKLTSEAIDVTLKGYNSDQSRHPFFRGVKEVKIVDELTADVLYRENNLVNLLNLKHVSMPLILSPKASSEGFEGLSSNVVGTGPWKLKSFVPDQKYHFERNKDYWGDQVTGPEKESNPYLKSRGNLDEVIYVTIKETSAQVTALRSGDVDVIYETEHNQISSVRQIPGVKVDGSGPQNQINLYMNTLVEPLNDVRVRKAINHAIDRKGLNRLFDGNQIVAETAPLLPWYEGYDPEEQRNYTYDQEMAKSLMGEAGYKDGFDAKLVQNPRQYLVSIANGVGGQLKEIGINLDVETMDTGRWMGVTRRPGQTAVPSFLRPIAAGSSLQYFDYWHAKKRSVGGSVDDPELDEILDKARTTLEDAPRAKLFKQAAKIVLDKAYLAWIFHGQIFRSYNADKFNVITWQAEGRFYPYMSSAL